MHWMYSITSGQQQPQQQQYHTTITNAYTSEIKKGLMLGAKLLIK